MRLSACFGWALSCVAATYAGVDVPRGYYLADLSDGTGYNRHAHINNHGDVVWSRASDPYDGATLEIQLYQDGEVRALTNNDVYDNWPSINDDGVVVWSSATGPGGELEIWMFRDGQYLKISDEWNTPSPRDNVSPEINNNGVVVWERRVGDAECGNAEFELWIYDGAVRQLTDVGRTNEVPRINDDDVVVWTQYDLCTSPWTSQILKVDAASGVKTTPQIISEDETMPQMASIDNQGILVWTDSASYTTRVRDLTGVLFEHSPSLAGRISDHGVVTLNIWQESNETWQVGVWRGGELHGLTDDPFWNADADPNDRGEVVWTYGEYPHYQTRAIFRRHMGDMDCDGNVGLMDIAAFVEALTSPQSYLTRYSDCDPLLGDFTADQVLSVGDIAGFVAHLVN